MRDKNKYNEHEAGLSALIDLIPDSVVIIDDAGKILVANKAIRQFTGYKREEIVGKTFTELSFLGKEDKFVLVKNMKKRLDGSLLAPYEIGVIPKYGERKFLEAKGNKIKYNEKLLDLVIFHDVTERSDYQEWLQQHLLEKEIKFQEIEKRYCTLFEQTPTGLLLIDPETTAVVEFNDAAYRQLGYSKDEFEELHISDFEALEQPRFTRKRINKILKVGQDEFETKHRTKDGKIRNVLVHVVVVQLSGKKFLLNMFNDVTEIRKVQYDWKQTEEIFRGIVNSVRDAIILVNEEAKITFWNPAAQKTFGYTSEEAIGRNIHELVVPNSMCKEGKARIDASIKTFRETGTGYFTVGNVELAGRRKDGSEFPAKLAISPMKLGGNWNAVGVVKDITDRKQAEQQLNEAEQRYHALFQQAPLGVLIIDPKTAEFVEFNDIAHSQLGYSREEFRKLTIPDIEAIESPNEVRMHIAQMVKEGGGEYETEHRTKDHDIRKVLVTTRTFELSGKTFLHSIYHDITEIKKMQEQLSRYSQKLEELVEQRTKQLEQTQAKLVKSERFAAIGELAGMVGHDLRNPLTGIKNSAYFLKKKGNTISQDQATEMLETIDKCVDYSNKIVNDLLDYSKEIHLDIEVCQPRALLIESLRMVNVPEKVEIVNCLSDEPQIKVDSDKIKRVFVNLIKNAVDAMQNVGKITVDSRHAGDNLEISFTDTGTGISDDVLPKLFAPLVTSKAQGMGFGLAICKRIIEAHGGTITVETVIGKGTTFRFSLPIEPKPEVGGETVWINMSESLSSTMTKP